jgi:hydrogenase-4 component B
VRTLRRPRGLFPARARYLERVPETVLERVVEPIAGVILRGSTLVRRLQHGRLQFYIVYVVAGLAAVGTIVVLEARP